MVSFQVPVWSPDERFLLFAATSRDWVRRGILSVELGFQFVALADGTKWKAISDKAMTVAPNKARAIEFRRNLETGQESPNSGQPDLATFLRSGSLRGRDPMVHKLNSTRRFAKVIAVADSNWNISIRHRDPTRPRRRMEFHEHRRAFRRPRLSSKSSIPTVSVRESRSRPPTLQSTNRSKTRSPANGGRRAHIARRW